MCDRLQLLSPLLPWLVLLAPLIKIHSGGMLSSEPWHVLILWSNGKIGPQVIATAVIDHPQRNTVINNDNLSRATHTETTNCRSASTQWFKVSLDKHYISRPGAVLSHDSLPGLNVLFIRPIKQQSVAEECLYLKTICSTQPSRT